MFHVPQNCICAPIPIILDLCSPKANAFVPLFPKSPEKSAKCKELYGVWYDYVTVEEDSDPLHYTRTLYFFKKYSRL